MFLLMFQISKNILMSVTIGLICLYCDANNLPNSIALNLGIILIIMGLFNLLFLYSTTPAFPFR